MLHNNANSTQVNMYTYTSLMIDTLHVYVSAYNTSYYKQDTLLHSHLLKLVYYIYIQYILP